MGEKIYELHADLCKIFTSSVRLEIIDILHNGKKSVSELVELTDLSQSNISQHLQILREKDVVRTEKVGRYVFYALAYPKISDAFAIMQEILMEQFAETEKVYQKMKKG